MSTDYSTILNEIHSSLHTTEDRGKVADYIPELANVDASKFGIALVDQNAKVHAVGDSTERFSIQSVSKVFALLVAFNIKGTALWQRVGVEPSGDPFNQLSLLEHEKGIPRNPFINPGAIVICDVLLSELKNPEEVVLKLIQELAGVDNIAINSKVAASERKTGFGNFAAAYLMKSFGNLRNPIDDVVQLYFNLCAIEMSCVELAKSFYPFFNSGKCALGVERLSPRKVKRINAIMLTCGFYDEAGEFAFELVYPVKVVLVEVLLPYYLINSAWLHGRQV